MEAKKYLKESGLIQKIDQHLTHILNEKDVDSMGFALSAFIGKLTMNLTGEEADMSIEETIIRLLEAHVKNETPRIKAEAREEVLKEMREKFTDEYIERVTEVPSKCADSYDLHVLRGGITVRDEILNQILNPEM